MTFLAETHVIRDRVPMTFLADRSINQRSTNHDQERDQAKILKNSLSRFFLGGITILLSHTLDYSERLDQVPPGAVFFAVLAGFPCVRGKIPFTRFIAPYAKMERKPQTNTRLKVMQAIDLIVAFNEQNPTDRWCISQKLLLKITGSGNRTIANLVKNDPEISTIVKTYNDRHGLSPRDNQRGRGRSFPWEES